jgi:hydroxyethylthiazole kinase-like uncharacterized protein yjeF
MTTMLLTAKQFREWDAYTILHEPVASIDLMERAASLCAQEIDLLIRNGGHKFGSVMVYCGMGNNGGDGLVIARHLLAAGHPVQVCMIRTGTATPEAEENLLRLRASGIRVMMAETQGQLPVPGGDTLVVDAIFGSGISRAPAGIPAQAIDLMNNSGAYIVSVDMPSGLPAEVYELEDISNRSIVRADLTLTFQLPKRSFVHAECFPFTGNVRVIDIGLHPGYLQHVESDMLYSTSGLVAGLYRSRGKFSHKGTFGHALLVAGSYGKVGAAVLCSRSAMRAGCGLLTAYVPKVGYTILQTAVPEAMVSTDDELYEIRNFPDAGMYDAVGAGLGMGMHPGTQKGFARWLSTLTQPVVLDADALNICAALIKEQPSFMFPANTIITPHPKEFDRLAGHSAGSFERQQKQVAFARKYNAIVVLKGAYTSIVLPDGKMYVNSSGNPALATAGSGDVLTGIITSLLAQQYTPEEAAVMGVYIHGCCADRWVQQRKQVMIAGDIIDMLPEVLYTLGGNQE